MEAATLGARRFENAGVGLGIGAQDVGSFLVHRGRAHDDLAIWKGQGAPFGQKDGRSFGGGFHAVRFVNEQDSDVVSPKVAGGLCCHDLERTAGEAPRQKGVAPGFVFFIGQGGGNGWGSSEDRFNVADHVISTIGLGGKQAEDRRGFIGNEGRHGAGQERGEAHPNRLDQRHPFNERISDAVRDFLLEAPQAHGAGLGGHTIGQTDFGFYPIGQAQAGRRYKGAQGLATDFLNRRHRLAPCPVLPACRA